MAVSATATRVRPAGKSKIREELAVILTVAAGRECFIAAGALGGTSRALAAGFCVYLTGGGRSELGGRLAGGAISLRAAGLGPAGIGGTAAGGGALAAG
jgi:hypothetical protein